MIGQDVRQQGGSGPGHANDEQRSLAGGSKSKRAGQKILGEHFNDLTCHPLDSGGVVGNGGIPDFVCEPVVIERLVIARAIVINLAQGIIKLFLVRHRETGFLKQSLDDFLVRIIHAYIFSHAHQVEQRGREIRPQGESLREHRLCLRHVTLVQERQTPAVPSVGMVGIQGNGPVKTAQRLIQPVQDLQHRSPIVMGVGVVGFEFDGPVVAGERLIQPVQVLQDGPAIVVGLGAARKFRKNQIVKV